MLTTGQIIANQDSYTATVSEDNIVRHLIANGRTWREYTEDLPEVGYVSADVGGYDQHHNPLSYFSDVRNDAAQRQNLVPFSQLAADMAEGNYRTTDSYRQLMPTMAMTARHWQQTNGCKPTSSR